METRRVIGIMWVVWTVLASLLLPGEFVTTVRALVGEDVLLPCVCPPSHKHYLVWQIGQHTTVDYAIAGEDRAIRALQYQNRTRLFHPADNGNCSLLLHRARLADAKTYSCHYDHIVNVTVTLEVAVNYSLQCSNDSSGEQYRCSASGGFPKGRIYWLQDGQAVEKLQGPLSELHSQDHLTGLYNITSTLRTGPKTATLQCVVENPSLQRNITADCRGGEYRHKELQVSVELKASLAVGSALFLLLATVCLTILLRVWKPCPSTKAPVPYEAAPLAEVQCAGDPSPKASPAC
ncbi:ICOS ligand isoform X1 [Anguilla rostrata]|uniref:ICOS ligand isoform X1 n=1 Tax=Anguilla rostrata TaxID=7938 RepID=UPI0030D37580